MHRDQFDDLVRILPVVQTRRNIVVWIAVAIGLAIGHPRPTPTRAQERGKPGSRCRRGIDCESLVCRGGRCRCRCGQIDCRGVCRDPLVDPAACGRCGNACADPFDACVAGVCHPSTVCAEPASPIACPSAECRCRVDTEGAARCVLAIVSVPEHFRCRSTGECVLAYGRGHVCADGERLCTPLCPGLAK
jgi:hypothetical protein